jgi:hypothetical protein
MRTAREYRVVLLVGAPRSGTTLVGNLLAGVGDSVYLEEKNAIWRYRNARLGHDELAEAHATPAVRRYIRRRFFGELGDRSILIEKTPANALRPMFVASVFPEAKIIFLRRSGNDVCWSR